MPNAGRSDEQKRADDERMLKVLKRCVRLYRAGVGRSTLQLWMEIEPYLRADNVDLAMSSLPEELLDAYRQLAQQVPEEGTAEWLGGAFGGGKEGTLAVLALKRWFAERDQGERGASPQEGGSAPSD